MCRKELCVDATVHVCGQKMNLNTDPAKTTEKTLYKIAQPGSQTLFYVDL